MSKESPSTNVLDYVSSFCERLHKVCDLARISLSSTQAKMKAHFDQKSLTVFRKVKKSKFCYQFRDLLCKHVSTVVVES